MHSILALFNASFLAMNPLFITTTRRVARAAQVVCTTITPGRNAKAAQTQIAQHASSQHHPPLTQYAKPATLDTLWILLESADKIAMEIHTLMLQNNLAFLVPLHHSITKPHNHARCVQIAVLLAKMYRGLSLAVRVNQCPSWIQIEKDADLLAPLPPLSITALLELAKHALRNLFSISKHQHVHPAQRTAQVAS